MPDKLLDLKNDLVFQELFGNPKNSEITAHLLSLILKREIYNIDLDANRIMIGNSDIAKSGRLDIRAKFNDGEDCNIELQVKPYKFMESRMLEYWAMMYSNKIHKGERYEVLKPSISILITNYKLEKLRKLTDYHTVWNLCEEHHNNFKLTNDIQLHILEMPKVKKFDVQNDELAQWLRFIANPEDEEVQKFMYENKFIKQAKEELAYLSGNKDFQRLVESRAGFLMDQEVEKNESKKEGFAVGKAEGRAEIAKKMKAKKISIDEISELTGLTKEEIEKL